MEGPGKAGSAGLEEKYTYYAFISYKHADAGMARWLQRKLQTFRLPVKTHKKHPACSKILTPVFLDETNLRPGILNTELKEEIRTAKYLIVLCSRAAHDNPFYLNQEIQYFLDTGHDISHIIPLIIDESDNPEIDCFPSRLQELCREQTILGANIHENGKKNAFLKIVAYMHGIQVAELESDEDRRRKTRIFGASVVSAAIVLALVIAGKCYYDYYVPKTDYYIDYAMAYGIPEGIGKLSPNDTVGMNGYYAITTCKNRVVSLEHLDSYGNLRDYSLSMVSYNRPIKAVFEYSEKGALDKVIWYDSREQVSVVMNYSNQLRTVDLEKMEQEDSYSNVSFLASDAQIYRSQDVPRTNIVRYLVDYDENGFEKEIRYVSDTTYNYASAASEGVYGVRYERDGLGRVTGLSKLTCTGDAGNAERAEDYVVMNGQDGVASVTYEYEGYDLVREISYDDQGRLTYNEESAAVICYTYDESHNVICEELMDIAENPVLGKSGYSGRVFAYDERGNLLEVKCFDTEGSAAVSSDGYAGFCMSYDADGRRRDCSYYGEDGSLVLNQYGCARESYEYDGRGNMVKFSCYGVDGLPVMTRGGYAGYLCRYDEENRAVWFEYLGTDGNRTLDQNGICIYSYEYNDRGYLEKGYLYGTDGSPVWCANGFSAFGFQYDIRGNAIQRCYFGTEGELTLGGDGYAYVEYEYDDSGRCLSEFYYDCDGNLTELESVYAGIKYEYNEQGLLTAENYYNKKMELAGTVKGYASICYGYDVRGNNTEIAYYDKDGLLMVTQDRAAVYRYEYDDRNRLIRIRYYDADEQPCDTARLGSMQEYILNEDGTMKKCSFYDKDGNNTSYNEYRYDERRRTIEEISYGPDGQMITASYSEYDVYGNVTLDREVYADGTDLVRKAGWDYRGNLLWSEYYANGEPVLKDGEYFRYQATYDDRGLPVLVEYLDSEGHPVMSESNGCASWRCEYDERYNLVLEEYYDEKGELYSASGRTARIVCHYDEYGRLTEKEYYDKYGEKLTAREDEFSCVIMVSLNASKGIGGAHDNIILYGFGDWDYGQYENTNEAIEAFGEYFESIRGKVVDVRYLYYDAESETYQKGIWRATVGSMGVRIMDLSLTYEEYLEIMSALSEN